MVVQEVILVLDSTIMKNHIDPDMQQAILVNPFKQFGVYLQNLTRFKILVERIRERKVTTLNLGR